MKTSGLSFFIFLFHRCSTCQYSWYCSPECQRMHLSVHRTSCALGKQDPTLIWPNGSIFNRSVCPSPPAVLPGPLLDDPHPRHLHDGDSVQVLRDNRPSPVYHIFTNRAVEKMSCQEGVLQSDKLPMQRIETCLNLDMAPEAVKTFVKDCEDPLPVRTMSCSRVDKITE